MLPPSLCRHESESHRRNLPQGFVLQQAVGGQTDRFDITPTPAEVCFRDHTIGFTHLTTGLAVTVISTVGALP